MTTIAAIQGPGWAAVAWDSRVVEEDSRIFTLPKSQMKVSHNNDFLLGAAGDMRAINLLTHTLKPTKPPVGLSEQELDAFMGTKFLKELKKCFDDAQYGEKGVQDSSVIALVQGRVYEFGSNYDWCHDDAGFYAVGTGAQYALGALSSLLEGKKITQAAAREALGAALAASCKYDPNTGGPIHISVQSR